MSRPQLLWTIGVLSSLVLVITAKHQIYDNNFYSASEAVSLLAGDHPYRDFFEWGVPLQAALSTLMQVLTGRRLIGEFLQQWALLVAGMVVATHLALKLSHSVLASATAMLVAVVNLGETPTVHYSKVFIYPCAIALMWRYLERPDAWRAAAMGAFAAVAFLLRHDHGVYVGAGMVLTFVLARLSRPESRALRSIARDVGACTLGAAVLVVPWAVVVERNEGLINYVVGRAFINSKWQTRQPPFTRILAMNPFEAIRPDPGSSPNAWLPGHDNMYRWLAAVTLFTTVVVLIVAVGQAIRRWRPPSPLPRETAMLFVAGGVVALVQQQLYREAGYYVLVAPLTAAFAALFLAGGLLSRTVSAAFLFVSLLSVGGILLQFPDLITSLPETFKRLTISPPVEGLVPESVARDFDQERWRTDFDYGLRSDLMVRYMHDCTATGDHILVMGLTPYQIPYYVNRPMAGGHLYWHDDWRSDPMRDAESARLLERQSVPFVFSTHNPILEDLADYPRVLAYVEANYVELEGSRGHLMVDRRRHVVSGYGALGFPCF